MAEFRSDDDIYRVRLVWLGPPGYPLPFQLPYAEYGVGFLLCVVLSIITVAITGNPLDATFAIAVAILLTAYIWRYVNPDVPARMVARVAVTDSVRIRPPEGDQKRP